MNYADFRIERKFSFGKNKEDELIKFLLLNNFKPKFERRVVNSIYLDTPNYNHVLDNINGVNEREKLRIRWYNDDYNNFSFENKKKNKFCILKKIIKIKSKIRKNNFIEDFKNEFFNKYKKNLNFNYKFVLLVSYERKYWVSTNEKIRATVDYNISTKSMIHNNINLKIPDTILEFKFAPENEEFFRELFCRKKFNFRIRKFSKYVNAFSILHKNGLIN